MKALQTSLKLAALECLETTARHTAFRCHDCTIISTQQARWKLALLSAQAAVTPPGCREDNPSVW